MDIAIAVKNVSKIFEDKPNEKLPALENINLEIQSGEIFIILGPSGSGKSTLLRILSGLEKSFKGTVKFGKGLELSEAGFVFQQFALLPWLSVYENIGLGLTSRKMPEKEKSQRIENELKRFGLEKFANSRPKELSGGMRQRVGIARALAIQPKIIFMDEAFSELDSFTAMELRQEILNIWQEKRPTIVMVTHNIEEALELGDRIAVLTKLPGRIEKIVENTLPRPRQKRSQEFFDMEDKLFKLVKP